ncbi:heme exporter protein CcmB [Hansschlegelia zhihuaiae]|uniref:Heme exporter protein B n=1 Tax=Hansschlegelia zhihuaiae TaxID=405005 RepID=A0A4Q0M955_9HYPH|nr:heme exporter protein CcmB [Hansschlegelia zhihuaiae]RXF69605.1 heme exporter protein CcmB [Hansschlegelia zhihuaiae]
MTSPHAALLSRDLALARGGGAGLGLVFFLLVVTLTPFAVGPDLALLRRIGPAILWLGALLATLLGLDRLLQADHEDGGLDLIHLAPAPLETMVATKILAHWLTTGLPLVLAAPLFGVMLDLGPAALGKTALALLVGTPALASLGAVGAALTVGLRRGGLLVPVLILPLAIPTLIFGVAASDPARDGFGPLGALAGLTLGYMVLGPIAAAAALRALRE